ncbi:hypothetical protein ES705_20498 [subsurface metagenome]
MFARVNEIASSAAKLGGLAMTRKRTHNGRLVNTLTIKTYSIIAAL